MTDLDIKIPSKELRDVVQYAENSMIKNNIQNEWLV